MTNFQFGFDSTRLDCHSIRFDFNISFDSIRFDDGNIQFEIDFESKFAHYRRHGGEGEITMLHVYNI